MTEVIIGVVKISCCFILSTLRTGKLIQSYKIMMAQSTRSKTSALGNSSVDKDLDDNPSYHDVPSLSSRKDSPFTSLHGHDNDSEYHSLKLRPFDLV